MRRDSVTSRNDDRRRVDFRLVASTRIAALCMILGCAEASHTALPVDLGAQRPGTPRRSLEIGHVGMAPNASSLEAVGTQRTGGFGSRDLAELDASLRATLATVAWPQSLSASRRLLLDVELGRYRVVYTKGGGAVLACVNWSLVDGEGILVHRAQFYVADGGESFRHAIVRGDLKRRIESAIVERIAKNALLVASTGAGSEIHPISVYRTYASLAEAVKGLPKSFDAVAPKGSHVHKEIDWTLEGQCNDG